ncbi:MAG TPA: DUF3857 domain-containing protein, partial [Cyclobacteriaceae bacterium]|nr:DUF3857 domain-containing protein [Cyclobacteriaceae bacterium]
MMRRSLLLTLLFVTSNAAFGQKGFGISSPPSWVEVPEFETSIPDTTDTGGFYYLLYNYQHNAETKQSYYHYAIKVVNDKGLASASAIDRSYDPAYERLDFHSLHIIRGSQKINHLDRNEFEIIQREENLSRAMYDGSLTAIVNLKDVKEGDIVVYSYSVTGANPVFKGHFFKTFYLDFGVGIGKLTYRLLTKPSAKLQVKEFGSAPEQKEAMRNGLREYRWERFYVPGTNSEDKIPGWHDPFNRVQLTDFTSWEQLSEWNLDLFKVTKTKSKALKTFIDSLKSIEDEEARVLAAIRTVQDKVRYFSFVDGMSSYRPHDPSEVFGNRYGDCKDKSLLLSEILNEVGTE